MDAIAEQKANEVNDDQDWSEIIEPQRGLLDLRLGELWQNRDLVMLFVRRDFVSVYKQTILGPLWFLIQPLLTTIIFTFIFGSVAKLPTDGLPQFLFYMSGTVVWFYFSDVLTKTSNTFVNNSQLFGKVYFPRMAHPTGYPVYLILARGFQLIPIGALAYRTNLMSVLATVLAAVLVYALVNLQSS